MMKWPFSKKQNSPVAPVKETSAQDPVLQALMERGDDGSVPRHSLFYFYGGDFKALAKAAQAQGYQTEPTADNDGVILEKTIPVDGEAFAVIEEQMSAWAEEFGSEYDGWECELVTN